MCSKKHGLRVRVKSGGHDYEGLSYLCNVEFVIIDLTYFKSVSIEKEYSNNTAWVRSGSTLGKLYYTIAKESQVHGFQGGLCPTIGIGGHFSGGGIGTLVRKYGLAAKNVIDAYLVDADGRGGGGGNFSIVTAWRIKLVKVPPKVTAFTIHKKMDHEGKQLVFKWRNLVNKLPKDLFIRVIIPNVFEGSQEGEDTTEILFNSLFLGTKEKAMKVMQLKFYELGLQEEDCEEMSWIESVLYFYGYSKREDWDVLLHGTDKYKGYFKAKSDFVQKPIPMDALDGIRERLLKQNVAFIIMDPLGGRMDEIPESESPFPHRKDNLLNVQYLVKWKGDDVMVTKDHIDWIYELYDYMKPYVSQSCRSAYINYRDLDLGINMHGKASYLQARSWGEKYFKGNFKRLALVESKADPGNFVRNEKSVPPIPHNEMLLI